MSSPAKKRKTNDYKASSQPVRGLDYFFAKQKDAAKAKPLAERLRTEDENASSTNKVHASRIFKEDGPQEDDDGDLYEEGPSANILSDEELARTLQEQWDKEDQVADAQANGRGPDTLETDGVAAESELKGEEEVPKQIASNSFFGKIQGSSDKTKGTLSLQSTAADEDTVTANIPFDESPLTFDPAKYIPDLQKHWATEGGHASYALLTRCFVLVNGTTSRIKIVDTLVNLLRCIIQGDPDSLLPAVRLL
jgi:DNA ligase-1